MALIFSYLASIVTVARQIILTALVAACLSEEEESEGGPVYRYHCYYYHRNYEEVSGRGCQDDEIPGLPPGGDRPFNAVEREEV